MIVAILMMIMIWRRRKLPNENRNYMNAKQTISPVEDGVFKQQFYDHNALRHR